MGKEIKKIESRQDVLDVWVSKWAVIDSMNIKSGIQAWRAYFDCISYNSWKYRINIYQILYSPESNFRESMFWEVRDGYHKKNCVDSLDPLQYIIDHLNETNS